MQWVYINNEFLQVEKALLPYNDLAIQRGYAIFDFFRLKGNKLLFLEEHLNRFFFSAEYMRLPIPYSREEIISIINELINRNNTDNTGIKLTLTGGPSTDDFSIGEPSFIVSQHTFKSPTQSEIDEGIRLMTFPHQRQLPQVKSIDYIMSIWLQPILLQNNVDDVLYHQQDIITESPRSNFFIITQDDKVVTPSLNILKGITRMKVLQKASQFFEVEERNIFISELRDAKEAFITSTTKQILSVSQVDDFYFECRTVTRKLQSLLE